MLFYSGARHRDIKYVVRQTIVERDNYGRVMKRVPGVYATFRNHMFDSKKVQRQLGWTDEIREEVEQFLLNHPHSTTAAKGRRIYTMAKAAKGTPVAEDIVEDTNHPCAWVTENEDGLPERCAFNSLKGSLYCDEHTKQPASAE